MCHSLRVILVAPALGSGSCGFLEASVIELKLDHAVRGGVGHGLADIAILVIGEPVEFHRECVEGGLFGEEGDQKCHAFLFALKPLVLSTDGDLAQGLDGAVSECREELDPLLCTGECLPDVE